MVVLATGYLVLTVTPLRRTEQPPAVQSTVTTILLLDYRYKQSATGYKNIRHEKYPRDLSPSDV